MSGFPELMTSALTPVTVVGEILIIVLLVALVRARTQRRPNAVTQFFGKYGFMLSLLVALAAVVGSLTYSEIAGFEPCVLCWYQRIFMYPLVILFAVALWKKDEGVTKYVLPLAVIGAAIAAFHYIGQMFLPDLLTCEAVGSSASCAQRFFVGLGHITLPFMSFVAFVSIILFTLARRTWRP